MAKRPIFIPVGDTDLVKEVMFEFTWHSGFAAIQKKKNVAALHKSAKLEGYYPILEVSTKSDDHLGQSLSAFNLKISTHIGEISLESAYQGSKVFELGGPYTDLYNKDSWEARKDSRLINSGSLINFDFFGERWPLNPKNAFYDWLYLSALRSYKDCLNRLFEYKAFTDIEFNPKKSVSCQARSCALIVSLVKLNKLHNSLQSKQKFIDTMSSTITSLDSKKETKHVQKKLPL